VGQRPAYPAHPGKVLKTLETSYSTECLSAHRLTVQRTEHIDGWTGAVLRRPDRSSSARVVLRHGNCHHFDALTWKKRYFHQSHVVPFCLL